MEAKVREDICIGGPYDGEILAGAFATDKVVLPVNPHTPSEQEIASWGENCPEMLFDQVEYRWAEGAWHYGVH